MKFIIGKESIEHYRQPNSYNQAASNERTIEVALGIDFFKKVSEKDCLEVGAVMPYYGYGNHKVLDAHDPYPSSIRKDAALLDYKDENILCLSTVEHMGNPANKDFYEAQLPTGISLDCSPKSGLIFLKNVIKNAKKYLVTAPVGYYLFFDKLLQENNLVDKAIIMKRDAQNIWSIDPEKDLSNTYSKKFNNANSIYIFTNIKEYHDNL